MVAQNSPDGLPAGYTVNCKVLKSGRKLKFYTELNTGKKFYSLNEVHRNMKSNNGNNFKIQQLNRCNSQIQKEVAGLDSPDRLPTGWTVNCKVLNSGRKLKYYTDLKTGKKFYSMNEVYRYISKNAKKYDTQTSSGKRLNGSMKKYLQGIKRTNSDLGWLLDGWLIERKKYEAGPKMGREYKVYVDKSTGHKCYSRLEVLRYVKKHNDKGCMVGKIKKAIVPRSKSCEYENSTKTKMEEHLNNVSVEYDAHSPNKKKLRSALNASSEASKISAPKVQKLAPEMTHLENSADDGTYTVRSISVSDGHIRGVQTRGSKKRQQSDLGNECTSTSTASGLKGDDITSKKFNMRTGGKNGSLPSRFSKRLARLEPELVTNYCTNDHDLAKPAWVKRSCRDQKAFPLLKIEKVNEQGHGLFVSDVDPILKEESTDVIMKNSNKSSNSAKNNRSGRLCRRFSKRLAGVEPELVSIPDVSKKIVQGAGKRSGTYIAKSLSVSAFAGVVHEEACQQHSNQLHQSNLSECMLNKSNSANGLELHQSQGLRDNPGNSESVKIQKRKNNKTSGHAKQLADVEQEAITDSIVDVKLSMPATSQGIPSETVGAHKEPETQQQNPIWHSWSDPCLEFAFKTLTGEISIEDDLQIASYFQQIEKPAQNDANTNNACLGSSGCSHMNIHQRSFPSEQPQADLFTDSTVGYNWINSQQIGRGDSATVKTGNR